jgi:hypothetical protein
MVRQELLTSFCRVSTRSAGTSERTVDMYSQQVELRTRETVWTQIGQTVLIVTYCVHVYPRRYYNRSPLGTGLLGISYEVLRGLQSAPPDRGPLSNMQKESLRNPLRRTHRAVSRTARIRKPRLRQNCSRFVPRLKSAQSRRHRIISCSLRRQLSSLGSSRCLALARDDAT